MEAKQQEWIIYITTNLVHPNKKIYVGQKLLSGKRDDKYYKGSGQILKLAFKKWGKENFHRETLVYCYSQEEANIEETYWIKHLDARNPKIGYNIHIGGSNQCGVNNSAHGKSNKPVRCIETGEIYNSITEAGIATNIHNSRISSVCKGLQITAGGKHWEYVNIPTIHKQKINKDYRVYCITNNIEYNTAKDAAKDLNLNEQAIGRVCRGLQTHTKNYSFRFVDKSEYINVNANYCKKVICIEDNKEFSSISDAATYYKISTRSIGLSIKGLPLNKIKLSFKLTE